MESPFDFSWQGPGSAPAGVEPGLEATSRFEPGNATFPFGTHICVVEVDGETGAVKLQRYLAVDDCGNVINPLIVDGQVHGGIAQGLAQALYEEVVYDENGQLLSGSLMDVSALHSGQVRLDLQALDVGEAVQACVDRMGSLMDRGTDPSAA